MNLSKCKASLRDESPAEWDGIAPWLSEKESP